MERIIEGGYTILPNSVIFELDGSQVKLLMYLINRFNINNKQPFFCYVEYLVNALNLSKKTIIKSIKHLKELGYINIIKKSKINYYTINFKLSYQNDNAETENNTAELNTIENNTEVLDIVENDYVETENNTEVLDTVENVKIAASLQSSKIGIENLPEKDKEYILERMIYLYTLQNKDEKKEEYNSLISILQKFDDNTNKIKDYLKHMYNYVQDNYELDGTSKQISQEITSAKNNIQSTISNNNLLYDLSGDIAAYRKIHKECSNMTDIEIAVEKLGVPKELFE